MPRSRSILLGAALIAIGLVVLTFDRTRSEVGTSEDAARLRAPGSMRALPGKDPAVAVRTGQHAPEPPAPLAEPVFSTLTPYQAEAAQPTLAVLAEMEESARERGQAVLLARVHAERARVLRGAASLPKNPPLPKERNEP
jgi:hypothetical protein